MNMISLFRIVGAAVALGVGAKAGGDLYDYIRKQVRQKKTCCCCKEGETCCCKEGETCCCKDDETCCCTENEHECCCNKDDSGKSTAEDSDKNDPDESMEDAEKRLKADRARINRELERIRKKRVSQEKATAE